MADAWDDEGSDAWDVDSEDDEIIEAKLGLKTKPSGAADFDDEEDLALVEKARSEVESKMVLKSKGQALAAKRAEEEERKLNEELTRKALELELERESKMTPDERRAVERQREIDSALEGANDLFGGVDSQQGAGAGTSVNAGDTVKMVDLKDHLMHAKKVGQCIREHKKTYLAQAFLNEAIQECKDVLDDDAITELIKTMNVVKNEKVAAAKKKVKGQAQKAKRDKAAEAKAKKLQEELYGDHDKYIDKYDDYGDQYEDDFF